MQNEFSRMEILLGEEGVDILGRSKVAIFGLGGAGSYAAEALARCGIGSLTLVDYDVISETNMNRQLYALHSTLGKAKAQVAKERILDISSDILVHTYETFYGEDTAGMFCFGDFDYIIDTTDIVASKILIIENAGKAKTPVISCMGTRNKMDPQRFAVGDISKAGSSGAAKTIREELRKKGINKVKVLYSKERPVRRPGKKEAAMGMGREMAMGSIAYIPGVAGLYIAGEVIRDLLDGSGLKK